MATKVFVGNLVFSTADKQLHDYFTCVGEVVSANIITRGRRSLGYGFVEFKQEEDAVKAVQMMDKKDIDGRPINVELAKPRGPAREEKEVKKNSRSRRTPKSNGESMNTNGDDSSVTNEFSPESANGNVTSPNNNNVEQNHSGVGITRRSRYSRGKSNGGVPRSRPSNANRPLSDTTVFVANIPYSLTREQLLEHFEDYNPKDSHIVFSLSGRSRGYGFVHFEDQEHQVAALARDGHQITSEDGSVMTICVKIAQAERHSTTSSSPNTTEDVTPISSPVNEEVVNDSVVTEEDVQQA